MFNRPNPPSSFYRQLIQIPSHHRVPRRRPLLFDRHLHFHPSRFRMSGDIDRLS